MTTFESLNLNKNIINGLKIQNITSPTDVQSLVFQDIKDHKDLIVASQTGSGKTLSYLIPVFEKIDASKRETQVLILAPTHELVMQINQQISLLSENSNMNITNLPIIGEVNIQKQIKNIKNTKPHIIVGSCGRVLDLIRQRKLKPHTIQTIVLDEVDNLLSDKSVNIIKDIIKTTLRDRQIVGFSASLNDSTLDVCNEIMKEPKIVQTKQSINSKLNPNITHTFLFGDKRDKFTLLRKAIAATNPKRCMVFVNDEQSIEVISAKLNYHDYKAICISGKMSKEDRKNALSKFKLGKAKILVTSDLSARGLDIVDTNYVFNLDFPSGKNEYIHRAGRCARGNKKGSTISIITKYELPIIKDYKKSFKINIKEQKLKEGKLITL